MPLHPFTQAKGKIVPLKLKSKHLAQNLLGDPDERTVSVYLPEGYDTTSEKYPLFMDLAGFTSSGLKHLSWVSYGESVPQRLDRLVQEKKMGPVIAVFPDCFTSLGGNQYINSSAMGNWADYLNLEVIPKIDSEFRTLKSRDSRAVFGKSSGGYGALVYGMKYADTWGAIACHSGDMAFDLLYKSDFPKCLDRLSSHRGDVLSFLSYLEEQTSLSSPDFYALMSLAMAATYDPDPKAPKGIRLPVDKTTCELDQSAWQRWLQHDPVVMIEDSKVQQNLHHLKGCFIDCGYKDQYNLHYGARQLKKKLDAYKIKHHYEEFDGTHSSVDYRMDHSLPFLYESLMA